MSTFNQMFRASFKGARFLPEGAITTAGGRKLIDHIYPNSERRFIEDLGKLQRDFTITGLIQGPNYFAKKNQLIRALESEGSGRLVHPFFGSIVVNARPYTLTEDLKEINVARFTMSFSIPSRNIFPTNKGLSNITSFANSVRSVLDTFLTTDFSIDFSESLLEAENIMNDVFDKFDDISRNFAQISDNITTFKKTINNARNRVASFIQDISNFNSFFDQIFDAINELFVDKKTTFNATKELFAFTGGDNTRPSSTAIRTEFNKNNDAINLITNTRALLNAYSIANLIEYKNDQELFEVIDALENQFDFVIDDLNSDIQKELYTLRDEFRSFSDDLFLNLDKVISINTAKMPLVVLTHRYYGDTSNYDNLIELNNTLNPSYIEGSYDILSNE